MPNDWIKRVADPDMSGAVKLGINVSRGGPWWCGSGWLILTSLYHQTSILVDIYTYMTLIVLLLVSSLSESKIPLL